MRDLLRWFRQAGDDLIGLVALVLSTLNDWFWSKLIELLSKDEGTKDRW